MVGLRRFFLILFFGGRRFCAGSKVNDGLVEVPNADDDGRTFHFKKFVYTSVGKVFLNEGDYVCRWRGVKFVVDFEGKVNKNNIKD